MKQGTQVICNGYRGAIIRKYNDNPEIWEVRVPGGPVAVGRSEFTVIEATTQPLYDSRCSLCWASVEHSFDAHREQLGMPAASEVRP